MSEFILYLIKSSLCLAVFYLSFKILLSQETFFRFNRWVLLAGTAVSLALPGLAGTTRQPSWAQRPLIELEERIVWTDGPVATDGPAATGGTSTGGAFRSDEKTASGNRQARAPFPWTACAGILYAAGLSVHLLRLADSFRSIRKIRRTGRKIAGGPYTLYLVPLPVAPFSWHRYIVMSEADYRDHPQEILAHERAHIRNRHTLDLIFMETILLFQWFNPAAWLLKRELKALHEYEADESVIRQGIDATQYQLLLVKKAVGKRFAMANSFNHSKIKNRITMMLKEKSNRFARLKPLLFIPLAAGILHVAARPEANPTKPEGTPGKQALADIRQENGNNEIHFVIGQEQTAPAEQDKNGIDHYVISGIQTRSGYAVKDRRMTPAYFEQTFLKGCLRTAERKEDLTDPKGPVVESHGVRKKADGTTENTPSLYLELSAQQEKELIPPPPPPEPAYGVWFYYKNKQEKWFYLNATPTTEEIQKQIDKLYGQFNGEIEKIVVVTHAPAIKESTDKLMEMLREKANGQDIKIEQRPYKSGSDETVVGAYSKKR